MTSAPIQILSEEPVPGTNNTNVTVAGMDLSQVTVTVPTPMVGTHAMFTIIERTLEAQRETYNIVNEVTE